jgi:hypothetical protein
VTRSKLNAEVQGWRVLGQKVFFYIPCAEAVESIPDSIEQYWSWVNALVKNSPARMPDNRGTCEWLGPYNWTLQTYLYLKKKGFPCCLTACVPDEGIIIAHSDMLPCSLEPSANQYIVEIKPDRSLRCTFANFVIVQNQRDPIHRGFMIKSGFVDYWPQPGLVARSSSRGNRFENICYIGNHEQLIEPEALSLEIRKLGLNWRVVPREEWHNYSDIDAIVAVRGCTVGPIYSPILKPASKLRNAWAAGVPAILSPDPAFSDVRKSDLDYLEARDVPAIIDRLKQLMTNSDLRNSMVENGRRRAEDFSADEIVLQWIEIITEQLLPRFELWRRSNYRRTAFVFTREMAQQIKLRFRARGTYLHGWTRPEVADRVTNSKPLSIELIANSDPRQGTRVGPKSGLWLGRP